MAQSRSRQNRKSRALACQTLGSLSHIDGTWQDCPISRLLCSTAGPISSPCYWLSSTW